GIDVGTTGAKTLAVDEEGNIAGRGYREYPTQSPHEGHVTQNAEDWWEAAAGSVREALLSIDKKKVTSIGLSTQGASMLAVGRDFSPLCPVLTWMDRRASGEMEELAGLLGEENIYRKTGFAINPSLDMAKIAWIQKNWPDIYKNAAGFVSTLEFINYKLTKKNVIDPTNAAIRQLMNMKTRAWDADILSALCLDEKRLPAILPSGEKLGRLTAEAAEKLGLPENVAVANGAHDQYCSAIGSGVINPGDMLLATGTAWVVFGVTREPLYTSSHIMPGIFPMTGKYGAMASMAGMGAALKWYRELIGEDYEEINAQAANRPPDEELLIYPYLSGAGFNREFGSKAVFAGLCVRHDKYDLARAIMEGVAFEARLVLEEFATQGMDIRRITMTGGAAKSKLWSEITGSAANCEIARSTEPDAACLGAAILAAANGERFSGLEEAVGSWVRVPPPKRPNGGIYGEIYGRKFQRYKEMYKTFYKS
ncbi:MAG: FGGY family carbohydrate kinase, partial [Oscillospiraceae bacterium]|nr:FGGY family carbohydrate kinase [Oscillospiraceae bacterium]